MIASAPRGTERPRRTPSCGLILTIAILLALAISRREVSIFPSIVRRAFETACREIPKLAAIAMLDIRARLSFQNSNCFSLMNKSTCQRHEVDVLIAFPRHEGGGGKTSREMNEEALLLRDFEGEGARIGRRILPAPHLDFDCHPFLRQHHIIEVIGEPLPRLSVDGYDLIRIDLIDDPGQVFPGCVARGVKLLVEDGVVPAAVLLRHREARRSYIEAGKPVPEPHKVDLHLLVEGLARRIDVRPAVRLYVEEVLHVEKGEA